MRKLFSIIGAVLLSVAVQANVVTTELNLDDFSAWPSASYNSETKVLTPTAQWGGGQIWLGTYDASDYTQLVLELASASTQAVSFTVNYADGTAAQQAIISAGGTSATIELNGSSVQSIYVALNSETYSEVTIALGKIYLKGEAAKYSIETLSAEEKVIGDWNAGLALGTYEFANTHAGDQVIINFETPTAGYHQIQVISNGQTLDSYNPNISNVAEGATQIRFTLTAADVEKVQANGIYIGGYYVTIKSVQLRRHAIFYTTSTTIESWSGGANINYSDLPALQDGNLLCFHVTAATVGGQIYLQHNWSDFPSTTSRNYVFTAEDVEALPKTFSIPVSHSLIHLIEGAALTINGQSFTFDEAYVAKGTPTTTVAKYLTVTDAGMATYILPFNVQDLPDGVEAYNLTNDGSDVIEATAVSALQADKPVLIVAAEGEYEFISEDGASDDVSGKTGTYTNGALVGTYHAIAAVPQTEGGNYNYVLQKHGEEVGFYQVKSADCALNPYRAYLSCSRPHTSGAKAAPMRIVFHTNTTTGVETVQGDKVQSTKVLRNGQLFILRNGVEYNVNGQMVK